MGLSVREQLECIELCLGMDDEPSESLWVSTKEKTGKGDIVVGVCYKPPDQEEPADETLYRRQEQPHIHRPWSSRGTSTTPISVGGTTQQGISNPGGSWNVLMITSFSK